MALKIKPIGPEELTPVLRDRKGEPLHPREWLVAMFRQKRKELLEKIAKGGPPDFKRWAGRWFDAPDAESMQAVQTDLRRVWEILSGRNKAGPRSQKKLYLPLEESGKTLQLYGILQQWTSWNKPGVPALVCFQGVEPWDCWVSVNPGVLRYQLAIAVSEFRFQMYRCRNPDCPRPYRLQERAKQGFCELAECRRMALLEAKKLWWHKAGKERRKKKSARRGK